MFFHGTNALFTGPGPLGLKEKLQKVPFKVALTNFTNETAMQADGLRPVYSLE